MSPATLGAELDRVVASFDAAALALRADPADAGRQDEVAHAAVEAFEVVAKIVGMRPTSLPALRLKAKALRHLFNAVPSSLPVGVEQRRLCQQIVAGLLDEPTKRCPRSPVKSE
ncbi:MAG: hypothetical protein ACOH2L_19995 [Devosia sp.]